MFHASFSTFQFSHNLTDDLIFTFHWWWWYIMNPWIVISNEREKMKRADILRPKSNNISYSAIWGPTVFHLWFMIIAAVWSSYVPSHSETSHVYSINLPDHRIDECAIGTGTGSKYSTNEIKVIRAGMFEECSASTITHSIDWVRTWCIQPGEPIYTLNR